MSGLEVLGIISNIISIVEATSKLYQAVSKGTQLPSDIHHAAARLPLVQDTLATASSCIAEGHLEPSARRALAALLTNCQQKASRLEKIFSTVLSSESPRTWKRIERTIRFSRDKESGELMNAILADLQVLVANHVVRATTREQVEELLHAAAMRPDSADNKDSGREQDVRIVFNSINSSGLQLVHTQTGNMNFNTGSGSQVNMDCKGNHVFYL